VEQLERPPPDPISAPMSVLRAVMMPANGAWMVLNFSSASSRLTLASADSTSAFLAS
jgi:hypothetical protein